MNMRAILFSLALCGSLLSAQPCLVSSNQLYTDARTGLTILGGTVALPEAGLWELTRDLRGTGLSEIRLLPPAAAMGRAEGARLSRLNDLRAAEAAQRQLNYLFWACQQYADQHGGVGPGRFEDLDRDQLDWIRQQGDLANLTLLPGVSMTRPQTAFSDRVPLAFEVRPAIDDGQHWWVWNNGQVERVPIDAARVAAHGLEIVPRAAPRDSQPIANDATVEYQLLARRSGDFEAPVTLTVHDRFSDRRLEVRWAPAQPQPGERELLVDWARLRTGEWRVMGDPAAATTLGVLVEAGTGALWR